MIKYVAFLKLKADTPPEALRHIEGQLRMLGRTIAEVYNWSSGRCLGSEGTAVRWTFALVADLRDDTALRLFQQHPEHEAFRELVLPYLETSVGMHYEAHWPYLGLIVHEGGIPVLIPRYRLPPLEC